MTAPHSPTAERALLGAMILAGDNDAVRAGIFGTVKRDWLYLESHRLIWDAMTMCERDSKTIDTVNLGICLRDLGTLKQAGGAQTLSLLATAVPTVQGWRHYAQTVQDDYDRRQLIAALATAQSKVAAEPTEAAAELVTAVNQILSRSDEKTVFDGIDAARLTLDMIIEAEKRVKAGKLVRWSMSTDKLADVIPLMPGKMHVLAMRSGGGKTSVACNGAQFTAGAGEPFGFHSVEMPVAELNLRAMSRVVNIDELSCLKGRPTAQCLPSAQLYLAPGGPGHNPLFITRPAPTIEDVERRVRHLYAVHGVRYHAVDYFQLLRSTQRFESRSGELNYIGQRLKQLTVELPGCAVLVLAQLNKVWSKENPTKEDIRYGSGLTDSADGVTLGWRPGKGTDDDREIVFRLDKGRFGGEGTQRFTWTEGRVVDGFAPLQKELNRRYELVRRPKEYPTK